MSQQPSMIQLVNVSGGDPAVLNAALATFGKVTHRGADDPGRDLPVDEAGAKVIAAALKRRKWDAFEHATMTWYIKCPIFLFQDWKLGSKHSSFTEINQTRKMMGFEPYVPKTIRVVDSTKMVHDADEKLNEEARSIMHSAYEALNAAYLELVELGVTKEQARLLTPSGLFTEFYWTVNSRSLMRFLSMHTANSAQFEIKKYAMLIEHIWKGWMPATHKTWDDNSRVAL